MMRPALFLLSLLAQAGPVSPVEEAPLAPQAGGPMDQLLATAFLIVPMFLIFYLLIIRPQKKKEQDRLDMLGRLRKSDRVLTSGGIYGTVMSVKDAEVVVRVDDDVKLRFARNAIVSIEPGEGGE